MDVTLRPWARKVPTPILMTIWWIGAPIVVVGDALFNYVPAQWADMKAEGADILAQKRYLKTCK